MDGKKLPTHCMVLPWPTYTDPGPKGGNGNINTLRHRRKKASRHTVWTHK